MMNLNKTSDEHTMLINRLASESLKNHVVTRTSTGAWRCGNPNGSSIYEFYLRFEPGAVLVWGDLGEFVLRHSDGGGRRAFDGDSKSLLWFCTASDPSYLLGKVRACDGGKKLFCYGDAMKWLAEQETEANNDRDEEGNLTESAQKMLDDVKHVREELEDAEHEYAGEQWRVWVEAWNDRGDWDPPTCLAWEPGLVWLWEARQCFVQKLGTFLGVDAKATTGDALRAIIENGGVA